ncbi:MAG: peptide deformylase [Bacteriovoracales bacterium]|nr:peptide deformylase [Bacteriovoracales bacterium]
MNTERKTEIKNDLENYRYEGDLLKIHTYPDPILKEVAAPVETFDEKLEKLCFDMIYTMYKSHGVGLAAPQIGLSKRIFVVDIDYDRKKEVGPDGEKIYRPNGFNPKIFINPSITNCHDEIVYREGCLSVPRIYDDVTRYRYCTVWYQDLKGEKHTLEASELLAVCVQHETDHLNGILFIEHLSMLKKDLHIKKIMKRKKRELQEQSYS